MTTIYFKDQAIEIHESWGAFFMQQQTELQKIEQAIGDDFTPNADSIFKVFQMPLDKIRFVIIGQDPYPQKGVATGRAFETKNNSWNQVNSSLHGVLCAIYKAERGEFRDYPEILELINNGSYSVDAPKFFFEKLEREQGVFMLNRSLTTKIGVPDTHSTIWSNFSNALIQFMSSQISCTWLLWGIAAQSIENLIDDTSKIVKTMHPNNCNNKDKSEAEKLILKKKFAENSGLNQILQNKTYIKMEQPTNTRTFIAEGHYRDADGTEYMSIWTYKRTHRIFGGDNSAEALQMQNFKRFRGPFTQSPDYKSGYMYDVNQLQQFYNN